MTQLTPEEVLSNGIMVDVETGGSSTAKYPLLSIGATVLANPEQRFYVELKPDLWNFNKAALAVCKLDPFILGDSGVAPATALARFMKWVGRQYDTPLFVAHNAPFDWMFFAHYADKYSVQNLFGYWAFDTKAAYGGIMTSRLPHHAGEDAYIQTQDLLRYYASKRS